MISFNSCDFHPGAHHGAGLRNDSRRLLRVLDLCYEGVGSTSANEGIAAMQSINVAATKFLVLGGFRLERPLHVSWLSLRHSVDGASPSAVFLLLGAVAYLAWLLLVTMVYNVPMNGALASLSPTSLSGLPNGRATSRRLDEFGTIVRTVASLAAAALLIVGLDRMPK